MSGKNKEKSSFITSVDTITTKLLTLVLFITVIPLMVVANFSTGIINQSMIDNAKNELNFDAKLAKEKYQDELNRLGLLINQAAKGYVKKSYTEAFHNDNKQNLIQELTSLKTNARLNLCLIVGHNQNVLISAGKSRIFKVDGVLAKLVKSAFLGETVLSTEVITPNDINTDEQNKFKQSSLYGLSQIIAAPIFDENGQVITVLLAVRNMAKSSNIAELINNVIGTSVIIYQIGENNSVIPVNLKLSNGKFISEYSLPKNVIDEIISSNVFFARRVPINAFELGQYQSIKSYFGNSVGIIYVGTQENKYAEPVSKNIRLISIISVISLIVAIIIAALFSRTITTPILRLVAAAKSIATGDLNQRVKIKGHDEIAQLSKTFNQMADDLQKQEQLKDNFVATLTHDLKVPMLAENQTINYFIKESYGPITQEQKEVLELIKSTNNSSLEMVSTLLEVYRYDTGNVQLIKSEFDIIKLVKDSIDQIKSLAEDKKINISLDSNSDSVFIKADEREIKRVMHNLISNAIYNGIHRGHINCEIKKISGEKNLYYPKMSTEKYTTLKRPIDISNSVLISVKDDGIGITREDIMQLFKRFSLNKGRKPAGSGLGLYYSYQVIAQHKGYIWAESTEGQGSTFLFSLPLEL